MRAFALFLALLFTAPPGLAEFCARSTPIPVTECEDEQRPAAPGHRDHQPGAPCQVCSGAACPGQRPCTRTGPALAAAVPGEASPSGGATVFASTQDAPSAGARRSLFHPPRA